MITWTLVLSFKKFSYFSFYWFFVNSYHPSQSHFSPHPSISPCCLCNIPCLSPQISKQTSKWKSHLGATVYHLCYIVYPFAKKFYLKISFALNHWTGLRSLVSGRFLILDPHRDSSWISSFVLCQRDSAGLVIHGQSRQGSGLMLPHYPGKEFDTLLTHSKSPRLPVLCYPGEVKGLLSQVLLTRDGTSYPSLRLNPST